MTHTSTEQPEARDLAYWIAHTTDNPTAALIQSLHARVQELETCLKKANAQAEHFEREWYLRGDELEASQAQREPLSAEAISEIAECFGATDPTDSFWVEVCRAFEGASVLGITQEKQG